MMIEVWLIITLVVSAALNCVLWWLLRAQSYELTTVADNSEDLIEMINSFKNHIKAVYSLDSFYGDETLKGLMDHAGSLSIILEDQYGDIASLSEPVEYEEQQEDQNGEKESSEKEKHVLYAGTRRRDS
jgi:hypothetical protein